MEQAPPFASRMNPLVDFVLRHKKAFDGVLVFFLVGSYIWVPYTIAFWAFTTPYTMFCFRLAELPIDCLFLLAVIVDTMHKEKKKVVEELAPVKRTPTKTRSFFRRPSSFTQGAAREAEQEEATPTM